MADSEITTATIKAAGSVLGIDYTLSERKLMVESLVQQRTVAESLRAVELAHNDAPASGFDPRTATDQDFSGPSRIALRSSEVPPLPENDTDIAFAPLIWLSDWIKTRQITSLRLTSIYLDRLRKHGPRLECVVTLTDELALGQAKAADAEIDAGQYRGPLHGIPWGAKDLLDTAGIETSWGAKPYAGRVPDQDAEVVSRLHDAGAVLVAKLALGALAQGDVWFGGIARNPWNPLEGASGSSAGPGSAVAAGLVAFALGTETLGSIVSPSMRNGVAGLRPTFGRVPRTGAMALCWSMDKIGPMTRRVEDTILVLDVLNGPHAGDTDCIDATLNFDGNAGTGDLKVGIDPAWFEGDEVHDLDRQALQKIRDMGIEIQEITLPDLPYRSLNAILRTEAATAFETLVVSGRDDELVRQDKDAWPNLFRASRFISAVDYLKAERLRRRTMLIMDEVFASVDVLLAPSFGNPLLTITNFTGHPSLTLKTGFRKSTIRLHGHTADDTDEKYMVPHGITIWGRLFDEGTLVQLGNLLEDEFGVWEMRPPSVL